MRTIKRLSFSLNLQKKKIVNSIAVAYAKEKTHWLQIFQQTANISYIKTHRHIRDQAVQAHYQSRHGLQARMWKLALQDAADTMDKYWQSLFEKIRSDIYQFCFSPDQRHYAFWLLKEYSRLEKIASFGTPLFKELALRERKKVVNYIKRKIRSYKKNFPRVKKTRSFLLDENCYDIFEHNGRQYIRIMTLVPRKRLAIPLTGKTPIKGNIRIVIHSSQIEVHYTSTINAANSFEKDRVLAVDLGYSEVFTDSTGQKYGAQLGSLLTEASDALKTKMQNRNKLHALHKKYLQSHSSKQRKKAKNILKMNLGRIKLEDNQRKIKATLSREMNTAFNQLLKKRPHVLISESLSHAFQYSYTRAWNRRLSSWVRGKLQERLKFKALAKGFSHYQVNPAYSSQTCLSCGYVDSKNRKGDRFQCLYCKHACDADWMAAMNLKSRYDDREITRFTPYRAVKTILLERFHRHLETGSPGTVSGRIPDTALT